mmetsp:Transcript_23847/g.73402  ORF Transcript_23847/g.73402 Transcript_23847/m.73402 type:complete len:115 (-) Transcript_23847:3377-3721(-)
MRAFFKMMALAGAAVSLQVPKTTTRRQALVLFPAAVVSPAAALASGATLEEAAKNAEKYRTVPACTPTNPSDCRDRYNKMLDPRKGLSQAELDVRDKRNDEERAKLRALMTPSK